MGVDAFASSAAVSKSRNQVLSKVTYALGINFLMRRLPCLALGFLIRQGSKRSYKSEHHHVQHIGQHIKETKC